VAGRPLRPIPRPRSATGRPSPAPRPSEPSVRGGGRGIPRSSPRPAPPPARARGGCARGVSSLARSSEATYSLRSPSGGEIMMLPSPATRSPESRVRLSGCQKHRCSGAGPVIRELHEHVPDPERLPQKPQNLLRPLLATGEDEAGEEPEGDGPGQADQAAGVLRERGQGVQRLAPVLRGAPVRGHESAQAPVPSVLPSASSTTCPRRAPPRSPPLRLWGRRPSPRWT